MGKFIDERERPIRIILSNLRDKQVLLSKKRLLRGSHFSLDEDLTIKQLEERRMEMSIVREARDQGKRAWLYKGKAIIASFGPHFKVEQQVCSKEVAANSLVESILEKSVWANEDLDSTLSLTCQQK